LTPNFTAGVMTLVVRDSGDVLFLRLNYRKGWGLPGGLLGRNERPEQTASRELEEELGIRVRVPPPYRTAIVPKTQMLTFFTVVHVDEQHVAQMRIDNVEVASMQWFPVDAWPELDREIGSLEEIDKQAARNAVRREA
jgi:8-oxo-dGTP pyrophosphatase MutT (NUDIX family)